MSTINTVPRTIIKAGLYGLRLPLTAIEHVTHNADANWTPAIAYESFEAEAKKILGSLVRDDELIREGRLQRAKVGELAESERLETKAEQRREDAETKLEARQESAEGARDRIEQDARQREQRLTEEKAAKQRRIHQSTERRKVAATKAVQVGDKAVTVEEKKAARTRNAEESAALAKRSQALSTAKKAQSLEVEIGAKRAHRKSS